MPHDEPTRLRQEISGLLQRRSRLEQFLLARRTYLHASLLERFLGTSDRKRTSPTYYLARSVAGRTRFRHVPKPDLPRVRREVDAWKTFQEKLAELKQLGEELIRAVMRFARAQEDPDYAFHAEQEEAGGGD